MNCRRDSHSHSSVLRRVAAFTLVELLLVIGIIGVLLAVLLPAIAAARRSAESTRCLSNLRQIALALRQYAFDNNDTLPDPFVNKKAWEASLVPYLGGAGSFVCPSDHEVAAVIGSSYDWRDTGKELTTLAGKSFSAVNRGDAVLALDALSNWHARRRINVAYLDGSARQTTDNECFDDLLKPVR